MHIWRAWDISPIFLLSHLNWLWFSIGPTFKYDNNRFHYLEGKDKKAMSQSVQCNIYPCILKSYVDESEPSLPPKLSTLSPRAALINSCPKPTLFTLLIWDIGQMLTANKICWLLWSLGGGDDKDYHFVNTLVCFSMKRRGSSLLKVTYLWSVLPIFQDH